MKADSGIINSEAVIRQIIQAANHSLNLDDVFQAIADTVGRSLGADRCFIARYEEKTGVLSPPTREYRSSPEIESMLEGGGELWRKCGPIARKLCQSQLPLDTGDTGHIPDDLRSGLEEHMREMGVRSGLCSIIRYHDECLAVLFIHQITYSRRWREVEKDILRIASEQTGVAIHHACLHQELEIYARRQGRATSLYKHALSGIPLQKLFDEALQLVCGELDVEVGKVIEALPGKDMRIRAVLGLDPELIGQRFDLEEEPHAGYSLEHLKSVIVDNIYEESRFGESPFHRQYGLVSGMTALIHGDVRPFGVLQADSKTRRAFSESDRHFMQMVAHILGVVIERKATIAEMRESQERFGRLVENLKDYAIYIKDPDGYIASWNQGAERLYGYTSEEVMGHHFSMLLPPERRDRDYWRNELAVAVREDRYEDEGWRVRHDGTLFWANMIVEPLWDDQGKLAGFSSITRDMTERKEAEEALRQSEARFLPLFESDIIGMLFFTLDGRIVDANDRFLKMSGYSREELEAGEISWQKMTPEEYRHLNQQAVEELTAYGWIHPIEEQYFRKDGSRMDVLVGGAMIPGPGEKGLAFVLDITKRKHIERDLAESNRDLELFAAIASHDLKAPLRKARMFLEKVMAEKEALQPRAQDSLVRAHRSLETMQELVEDLLIWARTSRAELHPDAVDLGEVMSRVLATLGPVIREKQARVVQGLLPVVHGDATQMEQLFQNLVENSLKYQPEDLDGHIPEVRIRAECPDNRACRIIVEDNGIGFAPDQAERIFRPFERLHGKSSPYVGTGIGLAICRRIAERHGGSIQAESEPGKGARFTIRLPFHRPWGMRHI